MLIYWNRFSAVFLWRAYLRLPCMLLPLVAIAGCDTGEMNNTSEVEQTQAALKQCSGGTLPCNPACSEWHCGGILWSNATIPYRVVTTSGSYSFTTADISLIDSVAAQWSAGYFLNFVKCTGSPGTCPGYSRWLEILPSNSNQGITDLDNDGAQHMSLASGNTSYYVAHELGHVIGLPHMFQRADRDRYVSFTSSYWCSDGNVNALTKCKTPASWDPAFPPIATGSFGAYNSSSVMNYISNDICEGSGSDPTQGSVPTSEDKASASELYQVPNGWSPFVSLGVNGASGDLGPLDYHLASNVYMTGSPAVCSWGSPLLDVMVRGTDGHIYYKYKNVGSGGFLGWSSWVDMGSGFNSDPACTSWASNRTDLVARKTDGNIYWKAYNGNWGSWQALGSPSGGAASAPTIASWGPKRLDVFVRGTNNRLYQKTYSGSSWGAWTLRGTGTFQGKPSAVSWGLNRIDVVVRGMDNAVWTISYTGTWTGNDFGSLSGRIVGDPAIGSVGSNLLDVIVRGMDDQVWWLEWSGSAWIGWTPLGGQLNGSPAVVGKSSPQHFDIVAPRSDNGITGVWWKYWPYKRPCYYDQASTGGTCGLCAE